MAKFRIIEAVTYEVEADSAEEAEEIFLQADSTQEFFSAIEERKVEEIEP